MGNRWGSGLWGRRGGRSGAEECSGGGDGSRSGYGGGSQSSPQVGAIAEPWEGVDSSKPPRFLVTVVALVVGGGLATPERLNAAVAGTILAPQGRYFP